MKWAQNGPLLRILGSSFLQYWYTRRYCLQTKRLRLVLLCSIHRVYIENPWYKPTCVRKSNVRYPELTADVAESSATRGMEQTPKIQTLYHPRRCDLGPSAAVPSAQSSPTNTVDSYAEVTAFRWPYRMSVCRVNAEMKMTRRLGMMDTRAAAGAVEPVASPMPRCGCTLDADTCTVRIQDRVLDIPFPSATTVGVDVASVGVDDSSPFQTYRRRRDPESKSSPCAPHHLRAVSL